MTEQAGMNFLTFAFAVADKHS